MSYRNSELTCLSDKLFQILIYYQCKHINAHFTCLSIEPINVTQRSARTLRVLFRERCGMLGNVRVAILHTVWEGGSGQAGVVDVFLQDQRFEVLFGDQDEVILE